MTEPVDESENRLYGLIEIAERQQDVAQTALEGMVRQQMALEEELRQFADGIGRIPEELASQVASAIEEARAEAVEAGDKTARSAMDSLQNLLDDASDRAERLGVSLQNLTRWLSWRFLSFGLASVAGLAILWWLANSAALWWDTTAIGEAQVEKMQLQSEIARLQATRESWEAAGMLSSLSQCGPKKQPCVKVDEHAGSFGAQGDYRILQRD